MLSLLNEVVDVQDELEERSWSVICLAVDNGIDVNKDTTSKDTIVSFGSTKQIETNHMQAPHHNLTKT